MNVLYINDSTTYPNWGGRAASIALRNMIEGSGGTIPCTLFIDQLEYSRFEPPRPARAITNRRITERLKLLIPPAVPALRRKLARQDSGVKGSPLIPRDWAEYDRCAKAVLGSEPPWPNLLKAFSEADVAVVFGDGDVYGNHVLVRTLLFFSYLMKREFGKPVTMVAHSADFDDPDLKLVADHVYPLFDDVVFRDPVSAERCRHMCDGRFAADTAFWFKPAPRDAWTPIAARPSYFDRWPDGAPFDPTEPYVCIGGSSLYDSSDARRVTQDYAALITHLRTVYEGQVVLTVSDGVDHEILHPLAKSLSLPFLGVETPVQQAVDVVGNAEAYIGGRYHPGVFALRGGAPVIALSCKTFKMEALTSMAGLSTTLFDAFSLSVEKEPIGQLLLSYLEQGQHLRSRLAAWAHEMAEDSWQNVAFLGREPKRVAHS